MTPPLLRCRDIHCRRPLWRSGESVVRGVSADFAEGRFHTVSGSAGSGHDLLLHVLGLLERPDRGEIHVGGAEGTALDDAGRDELRQRNFGFLFPACGLLPSLTVLENIACPLLKAGHIPEVEQREHAVFALQFCGLEAEVQTPVASLDPSAHSVVSFARAIVHRPRVLIAESPAGPDALLSLARRAVDETGLTVIWGTRPGGAAESVADCILTMDKGQLAVSAA
jgi:ABC-type lipoprotein export system ATPase subunit